MNLRTWIAAVRRRAEPVAASRTAGIGRKRLRKFRIACLWLLAASSSLWAGSGLAATYTVTSLGDAAGACTGTSPNFNCTTLRAAITAANLTTTVDDSILFGVSGTISMGSALPDVTDTVTLNGSGISLNGGGGAYAAIRFMAGADNSQLRNIAVVNFAQVPISVSNVANMVMNANTVTMSAAFDAIRCFGSDNCTITDNTITGGNYGISVFNNPAIAGYNATVTGNVLSGMNYGVGLASVSNVLVDSNSISATNFAGIRLVPQFGGVGSATAGNTLSNNTLSGNNGIGITFEGAAVAGTTQISDNLIQGNIITNNSGAGISFTGNANTTIDQNTITANTITGNSGDGIGISGATATGNAIYANTNISGNGGLGIDLIGINGVNANDAGDADSGPNTLMNYPVVSSIAGTTVNFTLDTSANANGYRIDFYRNPGGLDATGFGEGQIWLSSCNVATPSATVPSPCTVAGLDAATLSMTATRCQNAGCVTTATTSIGSTSEFSGPATTDLRISKTDGQTQYGTGQTLIYTIVVSNAGTTTVADAVFTDPVVSGLSVNGVVCGSPTSSSQCPAAAGTTVALMQGVGIAIPRLTAGGSVTFTVTATATASGGSLTNTAVIAAPAGVTENAAADNTASDTDGMQPSFGTCDSRLWLEQSPGAPTPTTLYQIGTNANPLTFNAVGTAAVVYNAVGYNPADNYQYGLITPTTNTLVRIGSDGAAVTLGAVSGLPVATYISGAFGTAGNILYVKSNVAAGTTMYAINVTTMTATPVSLSAAIDIADWAWVNGLLYGVTFTGQLVSVNPSSGAVANIGAPNSLPDGYFGAIYGAPNGLYGSGNNPPSGFYKFDLVTGTATLISGAPGSSSNDGSNCPTANITFGADLQITKTNTPASGPNDLATDSYTPGTARTYTVVVANAGPFGAANAVFADPPIPNFTVSAVTCGSPTGGGVCPSAANTTVALMQGSGIVIPSLPYSSNTSSSVAFSVTGTIGAGATGHLVNTATVAVGPGTSDGSVANNTAVDDDIPTGTIVIVKDAVPNDAQDFVFTTTGTGLSAFSLDDDGDGTLANTRTFAGLEPGSYSVTEGAIAGWSLTGLNCSDPDSGTATDLVNRTATIDVDSGETVTCTYTNSKRAVLRLQKALPLGRFVATDQFTLQIAGSGAPAPVTTSGTGTTATGTVSLDPAAAGTPYTLSETAAAGADANNYTATYACTNALAGAQTPSGTGGSFSVTPVAGDDLTCTIVNTRKPLADLTISKTNTPGINGEADQSDDTLTPGATTTYTMVVTNRGPDAVTGAVVRDPSASRVRLNCPGPASCSGTACPSPTLTVAQLDSGVTLGAMTLGDTVTVNLACTVQ